MRTYVSKLENLVLCDGLGLLKYFVGDVLGSGATVRYIVLDTEVVVWSTGVVRRCKKDTTIGLVLPDDVRRGGSRKDPVSADDKLVHAVRGGDLDDNLDGLWREITAIATNNEREPLWLDGIEDGLYKVLRVVLSNPDERQRGPSVRNPLNARERRIATSCWNIFTLIKMYRQISDSNGRGQSRSHRFLRPEVPGFWPSKGFVATDFTSEDMVDVRDQGARGTCKGRFSRFVTWKGERASTHSFITGNTGMIAVRAPVPFRLSTGEDPV